MNTLQKIRIAVGLAVLACTAGLHVPATLAQSAPKAGIETSAIATSPTPTSDWIKSKIEEVETRKDLDPAVREQALALYREALGQLDSIASSTQNAAGFQETIETAPARTAEIKQELIALQASANAQISAKKPAADLSLSELEKLFSSTQADVAKLKTEVGELDAALLTMSARPTAARAEQSLEKQALDQSVTPRATGHGEADLVAEARRTSLAAKRMAREAKINMLEQELISLPARQVLANARRELAAAKLEPLEHQIPDLEARINSLRENAALQKQAEAELAIRQLGGQSPFLAEYAKTTAQLRQQATDLTRSIENGQGALAAINAETTRLRDSQAAAQKILEIGRVGEEFGVYLRKMQSELPSLTTLNKAIRDRDELIVEQRLRRLRADADRGQLGDIGTTADRLSEEASRTGAGNIDPALHPTLVKLVGARRESLEQMSDVLERGIAQLAGINAADRERHNLTSQIATLLNNRLLWLPGAAPIGTGWVTEIKSSLIWMANTANWKTVGVELVQSAVGRPFAVFALAGMFTLLTIFSRGLRGRLAMIASALGRPVSDGYLHTPRALLISMLLASRWPLLLGTTGWLLVGTEQASEFSVGVGNGLLTLAAVYFSARLLQNMCAANSVFHAHFGWDARSCRVLANNLKGLMVVLCPAAFAVGMIHVSKEQFMRDGLGRLIFLGASIVLAVFIARIMSPKRGAFADRLAGHGALWMSRGAWYPLMWLTPLVLALFAAWGYYDGAAQVLLKLGMTTLVVVSGLLAYGVAMRGVLVARRRMELKRAYEQREKARSTAAAKNAIAAAGDAAPRVLEIPEIDVASISQQTRSLLRLLAFLGIGIGLWLVWRNMLPTLGILDDVALWTQTVASDTGTKIVPVTLSNVLLGLLIGAITYIAARNVPGLLEITLLQRLDIETGTRYAVTAIFRYLIVTIGIIAAFGNLGVDWSQMQWIVAALGVGVGFGLQEIVANFISGLIILFERPIRVGDTVTIGGHSGTVSRIQIRATSITDWDNKEVLIPNKSLITEQVMNWTLSDPITRLLLKVGIAYGSDPSRAQEVMLEAVRATSHVLEKPQSAVLFLGFGESSLDFEVRVFVSQPAHRLATLHELHVNIERALRQHNIEIPFPQRDLHLRGGDSVTATKELTDPFSQLRKAAGMGNDLKTG